MLAVSLHEQHGMPARNISQITPDERMSEEPMFRPMQQGCMHG
jgi:hypothetical protein